MNKKLLVAAIAAAATLPMAAQAGVQVYGVIHASIDYVSPDNKIVDSYWDVSSGAGRSRLGFKGSEDLGNGLKAIWKVESQVQMDSAGTFSNRNTYIGLAGDWGTFLYGRHDTPMKISTGKLDLFVDTLADYNATIGFFDLRANDAIAYISPNMAGFTLAAATVPGHDGAPGSGATPQDGLNDGYSIAAMYSNNALFASLAYEDISDWYNEGIDFNHWRAGLGWLADNWSIVGVYANQEFDRTGSDADLWQISGSYTFGNNTIKAMYGENGDVDFGSDFLSDDNASSWAIGLDHSLSKRTTAYVLYVDSERGLNDQLPETAGGGDAFSMGMVHKF